MDFCGRNWFVLELSESSHMKNEMIETLNELEKDVACAKEHNLVLEAQVEDLEEEVRHFDKVCEEHEHLIAELEAEVAQMDADNERTVAELEEERKRVISEGLAEAKHEMLKSAHAALMVQLFEENKQLGSRLVEETQLCKDVKQVVEEQQSQYSNLGLLVDEAHKQIDELSKLVEEIRGFYDTAVEVLSGSLVISKQPLEDHKLSPLLVRDDQSLVGLCNMKPTWLKITAPNARHVAMTGDFYNWELPCVCEICDEDSGTHGVLVGLPTGRWEFRFLIDGLWTTSSQHPTTANEHGSLNNYIVVE